MSLRISKKADKLNYSTFYQANVWVVMHDPVEVTDPFFGGANGTSRNRTEPG